MFEGPSDICSPVGGLLGRPTLSISKSLSRKCQRFIPFSLDKMPRRASFGQLLGVLGPRLFGPENLDDSRTREAGNGKRA